MFLSFLINSLIVSILLSIIFAILGIFVIIKRMSFFSDGLAHAAVLGLAISFLLNLNPLFFALIFAIIFSLLIYFLQTKTKINLDALIGLIFVTAFSLGLILMSKKAGYQPELLNFLIGNVLTIGKSDLYITIFFSLIVLLIIFSRFNKFFLVIMDPIEAKLKGINIQLYEILFYVILGTSVILGIKLVGVVLVTSFIILPPITASLVSKSFKEFTFISVFLGLLNVISGFFLSYIYNLPLGPSIVVVGAVIFFSVFVLKLAFNK